VLLYRVVLIAELAVPLQFPNAPEGRLRVACQSIFAATIRQRRLLCAPHWLEAESQGNGVQDTMEAIGASIAATQGNTNSQQPTGTGASWWRRFHV